MFQLESPIVQSQQMCDHTIYLVHLASSSVILEAFSHNWKVIGLIPSLVLISENPNVSKVLFLLGRPFFTTKDKVFAPFWSIAHGAELRSIICFHNSADGASLDKEILIMFNDGSSDHKCDAHFYPSIPDMPFHPTKPWQVSCCGLLSKLGHTKAGWVLPRELYLF